jgi:hypothetical protein
LKKKPVPLACFVTSDSIDTHFHVCFHRGVLFPLSAMASLVGPDEKLTAYEVSFAKNLGATDFDIEDMVLARVQDQWNQKYGEESQYHTDDMDSEDHGGACDCDHCHRMAFEGEADENNDGGRQATAEWRARVATAKSAKALATLQRNETWIRDFVKRAHDYRAKVARDAADFEARKKAYVHVEGTSTLLEYGMVPRSLCEKLKRFDGIKHVDTETLPTGAVMCRIHVEWPTYDRIMSNEQREEHFRILLRQEGISKNPDMDVTFVTWKSQ